MVLLFLGLVTSPAHALGPIPEGTYRGNATCTDTHGQATTENDQTVVIGKDTMQWGNTIKECTPTTPGFYKVRHYTLTKGEKVLSGLGTAYETAGGMHFKMVIDIGPVVLEGEDTFAYHDGHLVLISSVHGQRCEADYVKVPGKR